MTNKDIENAIKVYRGIVARWPGTVGPVPDQVATWLQELLDARIRISELEAENAELAESNAMACVDPDPNCQCSGCLYAAGQHEEDLDAV